MTFFVILFNLQNQYYIFFHLLDLPKDIAQMHDLWLWLMYNRHALNKKSKFHFLIILFHLTQTKTAVFISKTVCKLAYNPSYEVAAIGLTWAESRIALDITLVSLGTRYSFFVNDKIHCWAQWLLRLSKWSRCSLAYVWKAQHIGYVTLVGKRPRFLLRGWFTITYTCHKAFSCVYRRDTNSSCHLFSFI